jgi:hypothetical protein
MFCLSHLPFDVHCSNKNVQRNPSLCNFSLPVNSCILDTNTPEPSFQTAPRFYFIKFPFCDIRNGAIYTAVISTIANKDNSVLMYHHSLIVQRCSATCFDLQEVILRSTYKNSVLFLEFLNCILILGYYKRNRHFQRHIEPKPLNR